MKKLFSLLTLLIVAIGTSWATETAVSLVSYTVSDNTATCTNSDDENVTIVLSRPGGTLPNPDSKSNRGLRWQENAVITATIPTGYKINSVKLTSGKNGNSVGSIEYTVTDGTSALTGTWDNALNSSKKQNSYTWTAGTEVTTTSWVLTNTGSQGDLYISAVTVTYEAVGPVDPEFSLTKTSIGTNETSQIQVGTKGNLDGITFNGDVSYGTEDVVTVSSTGLVTPVAPGTTTLTFSTNAVDGKYNASSNKQVTITVTAPTYAVNYNLNGGSGETPTQDPQEADAKFNLAAAPTKDFSTFNGWLCSADGQTYAAGAVYTMTAAPTTFTAQWTVTTYSSTLDFAAETIKRAVYGSSTAPTGEKAFTNINTFLESGNMIGTSGLSNNNWEPSDQKTGFIGYKLKVKDASVKFMAKAGKKVTIAFGSIADDVTLKKNGVSSTVSKNSGEQKQTVVSFDAEEDMLVEIVTSSGSTVTLNKIAIEDAAASYTVNVGTTGFATVGLPFVTTVPSGVTAYTVSSVSGSTVVLSQEEAGATIPAYKGIIIVAEEGSYTFTEKVVDGTSKGDTGSSSLLATGAVTRNAATTAGEFYYFGIIDSKNKKVGFKKIAVDGTISDHKAYLPGTFVTNNTNSLSISFEGEATAINGIAEAESDADAPVKVIKNGKLYIGNYNVAGQQVK